MLDSVVSTGHSGNRPWHFDGWGRIVAAVTLLAVLAPSISRAQDHAAFSQQLVVGETGLMVDGTRALSASRLDTLGAADVVVVVDDVERKVTRIEPAARAATLATEGLESEGVACGWSFLVYVDTVLGSPSTVAAAALTVGQYTEELTQRGCVEVVVADPAPRAVLSASRAPRHIEKVLVEIAERARGVRDADPLNLDAATPARDHGDRMTIRDQWDRLISFIASHRTSGPRVLLLITDGFRLSPADMGILSGQVVPPTAPASGDGLAAIVMDTAQAISSYGWQTFALPMTNEPKQPTEPTSDEFERFREVSEGLVLPSEKRWIVNFFGSTRRDRATAALDDRLYEAYALPQLAPLRALAEATAGGLAWREQQFAELLDDLGRARLLWFESTEPHDGLVRRLQVRLADEQTFLRAPWWKRSSTPHLVAESRLRRLLAGESLSSRLVVDVELLLSNEPNGTSGKDAELGLRVAPVELPHGDSIGHIRVSVGFPDAEGVVSFEHLIDYDAPALGGDWQYSVPLVVPEGTVRLAVGVEDLSLEEWGASILEFPERPAGK